MKNRIVSLVATGLFFLATFFTGGMTGGCGGGGGDGGGTVTSYGEDLNDGFDLDALTCTGPSSANFSSGSFQVVIADGTMSPCTNADAPSAAAETSLPTEISLESNETNITAAGAAYRMSLGERGYLSSSLASATLTIPFDPALIANPAQQDALHVFARILNPSDNSVVDVTGTLSGNTLVITLPGLPAEAVVIVVYSPDMAAVTPAVAATATLAAGKGLTSSTWEATWWCVAYNQGAADVIAEAQTYHGISTNPTADQIASMVRDKIAVNAVNAQDEYAGAGFRQPNLYIAAAASEPCGGTLGTTPRFMIHYVTSGNFFRSNDAGEVVDPDGNHYGRLYISVGATNWTRTISGATVYNVIAHEMLHAIQNGYELMGASTKGIREGTATSYGETLDVDDGEPHVRSLSSGETFKLYNFLTAETGDEGGVVAYANQDFFVYVARQHNADSLHYLSDLFEALFDAIDGAASAAETGSDEAAVWAQPDREILFEALDDYFQTEFGVTLEEAYLDFLAQRAMEHNADSRFGRSGETVSGFAGGLFTSTGSGNSTTGVVSFSIDPLNVGTSRGSFGDVAPFAARAVRIRPAAAVSSGGTGATLRVALTPTTGSWGTTFDGRAYQNGAQTSLSQTTTFSNFGLAAADEIVLLLANVTTDQRLGIQVDITGDDGEEGGGGSSSDSNIFSLSTFTVPGPGLSPAWAFMMPDVGSGVMIAAIASTTDLTQTYAYPNLQVQFNTTRITGPGTYTVTDDVTTDDAAVLYSPGTIAAAAGTGYVSVATGGTLTLTGFGTATGDHIIGSFSTPMLAEDPDPDQTGTIEAAFDFVVGMMNNL